MVLCASRAAGPDPLRDAGQPRDRLLRSLAQAEPADAVPVVVQTALTLAARTKPLVLLGRGADVLRADVDAPAGRPRTQGKGLVEHRRARRAVLRVGDRLVVRLAGRHALHLPTVRRIPAVDG